MKRRTTRKMEKRRASCTLYVCMYVQGDGGGGYVYTVGGTINNEDAG